MHFYPCTTPTTNELTGNEKITIKSVFTSSFKSFKKFQNGQYDLQNAIPLDDVEQTYTKHES